MNTQTNQTNSSVQTTGTKRIILASAHRHEQHSTGRQERAVKTLHKMRRFEGYEDLNGERSNESNR